MKLSSPFGTFYRGMYNSFDCKIDIKLNRFLDGFESSGTALAIGTLEKVPFSASNTATTPNEFYAGDEGNTKHQQILQPFDVNHRICRYSCRTWI